MNKNLKPLCFKGQHQENEKTALAGMARLVGYCPMHPKVSSSVPCQGTAPGLGSIPIGAMQEAANRYFALTSMFLLLPSSL